MQEFLLRLRDLVVPKARAALEHRATRIVRMLALTLVIVWCVDTFRTKLEPHYPIDQWLFWVYARLWVWCAFFAAACVSAGHAALGLLVPRGLTLRARAVFSVGVGVLLFFLGMFVGGLLGLYGPAFAIALPATMTLAGAVPLVRRIRAVRRHLPRARARARSTPTPWWTWPVVAFGVLSVAAIYLSILTPNNIAFDSHFYHLGLAQEYATEGAIRPSREGWICATIPHLASVLYTWALLVPGFPNVERVLLAGHLEFTLFLATLASLPVLVRWLVPGARAGAAWVAVFLFPGIFLYDSSLTTAADHITAFWAPLVYLAFGHAFRDLQPRRCALFALLLGGAFLTKYQAVQLAIVPVLGIGVRALYLGSRAVARRRADGWAFLLGPAVGLCVGLLVTSPHWLKNWVWYGDPLYPYLNKYLTLRPWSADAASAFNDYFQELQVGSWRPKGSDASKLRASFKAIYKFSFEPHDWPKFHGVVPVFGSLFTLTTALLPFVRGARRLWGLYLGGSLAVMHWFWSMHQDRYLQVVLPWMAAGVAGMVILVWRSGVLPRLAMSALLGLQVVWGGDVYFIPGHTMLGGAPIRTVADLLAQGYRKRYDNRLVIPGDFEKISPTLPKDARVLNHEENRRLGYWRPVVSDFVPWQYGIRWGRLESPGAMHDELRRLGVTHIVWRAGKSRGYDTLAGDLRFFEYVSVFAGPAKKVGGRSVAPISTERPEGAGDLVAYLGCGRFYARGLHRLARLDVPELWPGRRFQQRQAEVPATADADDLVGLADQADFLVVGTGCKPAVPPDALGAFALIATRGKEQLYVRRRGDVQAAPAAADSTPGDDDDDPLLPSREKE